MTWPPVLDSPTAQNGTETVVMPVNRNTAEISKLYTQKKMKEITKIFIISALLVTIIFWSYACNKTNGVKNPMSDISRYFSSDYTTARQRFLEAAVLAKAHLHELTIEACGPDNDALTIDIAWIGSQQPRRVIVHTSGVHGVEGFCGSAIQIKALENLPDISEDGAIVFVHSLNPYGMAWLRRYNESNVDLNRNFLRPEESYSGAPDAYPKIYDLLNPKTPSSKYFFYIRLLYYVIRDGYNQLKVAITSGQYEYPQGLFFGGKQLEQGPTLYKSWLKKSFSHSDYIYVIDVHTGLGKWCQELLFHKIKGTKDEVLGEILRKRFKQLPYPIKGGHFQVFEELFPDQKVDFTSQEFGTYCNIKMLYALREENRYHHYGERKLDHPDKKRLKNSFYPDSQEWKESVLQDGLELFQKSAEFVFKGR